MADEFKPCPFCGSRNVGPTGSPYFECRECDCLGPTARYPVTPKDAWNTRTDTMPARLADVEAALDSIEAEGSITTGGNVWRFWRDQAREMAASADAAEARAKAAEAKLAKAVKSLQSIKMTHLGDGTWRDLARRREKMASDTLAEIGEDYE